MNLKDLYYILVIPLFGIGVFFGYQYLTQGVEYFFNNGKLRRGYLAAMATIQYIISMSITWAVLEAFQSEFLIEYSSVKLTIAILIGASPFSILILVWVALGLEARRFMHERYGDELHKVKSDLDVSFNTKKNKEHPPIDNRETKK